jgi:catechol 2,3-dioxygenase-like lactoylglutathione lyase family enzyme
VTATLLRDAGSRAAHGQDWNDGDMSVPGGTDRAVPNLPSRDFDATEAFYSSFGFERTFRDDGWMILARGGVQLEFFPHPELDPTKSDFMCSLRVADVDELFDAIVCAGVNVGSIGVPRLHAVRLQPWGQRAGYLIDLDGTQLALIEQPLTEPPPTAR